MSEGNADRVWEALASPERRRILDRLRDGPAPTGELTEFLNRAGLSSSRYATQRHLKVLRGCGLVLVVERGRERINSLNASALHDATIGWLDPHARRYAGALDRLRFLAETTENPTISNKINNKINNLEEKPGMKINHLDVTAHVTIAAKPSTIWSALTGELSAWWGAPYMLIEDHPTSGVPSLTVEPKVGALAIETLGDRQAFWGMINTVEPEREISWVGQLGITGATHGEVRFTLTPGAKGTDVSVRHQAIGYFDEATTSSYAYGWDDLIHRLAAHVVDGRDYGIAGENREPDGFVHQR